MPISKLLVSLFASLVLLSCNGSINQTAAIRAAVTAELQRYPQASLLDLYKFFFQGAFGPGHLIPNPEHARQWLAEELRTSTSFDSVRWEPVGYQDQYYRLNLSLVHDGTISADSLLAAFVASANAAHPPSLAEWRKEWQMILEVITAMALPLENFEADKRALEQQLAAGKTIGHHSEKFEQLYQPHYRVVAKPYFETLLRQRGKP